MGSWNTLIFSTDPEFVASNEHVKWLRGLGNALAEECGYTMVSEVEIHAGERPTFVFAGLDMAITCPQCGDEDQDQAADLLNLAWAASEAGVEEDPVYSCACGATLPLSHLHFEGCAYRRFVIELKNGRELLSPLPASGSGPIQSRVGINADDPHLRRLGRILGTELRATIGKI